VIKPSRAWAIDGILHDLSGPLFIFRMNEHFRGTRFP
jgi:hypothetical protein